LPSRDGLALKTFRLQLTSMMGPLIVI